MLETFLSVIAIFIVVFEFAYLLGPRPQLDTKIRHLEISEDLDNYLAKTEQKRGHVVDGAEKSIRWYAEPNQKTEIAIVYLHGFSATHKDLHPAIEDAAKELGANIYLSRLRAHGEEPRQFSTVTANDWLNDAEEAYQIGKRIGNKVVLVGMSTGATLATYLNHKYGDIYASILLAANFYPKNRKARFLIRPWGNLVARVMVGKNRTWKPQSDLHAKYWTYEYSSRALVQVMLLVDYVYRLNLGKIKSPAILMFYALDDAVDVELMKYRFAQFGSSNKAMVELKTADRHELAGDILNSAGNEELQFHIVKFVQDIRKLPRQDELRPIV